MKNDWPFISDGDPYAFQLFPVQRDRIEAVWFIRKKFKAIRNAKLADP